VTAIASEPISEIPSALVGDRSIAVELDAQQELRPVQPHYEVTISLENQSDDIVHQNLATVHIDIPDRTLQQTLIEFFNRNVRAEL
jgi:hypothetical protein